MVLREKTGLPAHHRLDHPAAVMGSEEEGYRGDRRQEGGVAQVAAGGPLTVRWGIHRLPVGSLCGLQPSVGFLV